MLARFFKAFSDRGAAKTAVAKSAELRKAVNLMIDRGDDID
jgi:hypothetical protein